MKREKKDKELKETLSDEGVRKESPLKSCRATSTNGDAKVEEKSKEQNDKIRLEVGCESFLGQAVFLLELSSPFSRDRAGDPVQAHKVKSYPVIF
jgi:hypothetical protein